MPVAVPSPETSLREALFTRIYEGERIGEHELDILFWWNTRHLLTDPSHSRALGALDGFISRRGEQSMREPLRRALLQRDLWQLYEWTHSNSADLDRDFTKERAALRSRIVAVMKRVALTAQEIAALPRNSERLGTVPGIPDFPRGLLNGSGEWTMLGTGSDEVAAPVHRHDFDGHSAFLVLMRLPGGRRATLSFLDQPAELAAARFPPGTIFGLVRLMLLIDEQGKLRPTSIIESLQLRRFDTGSQAGELPAPPGTRRQEPFEFLLDRRDPPRLRRVQPDEKGFPFVHFQGMGVDLLEIETDSRPAHPTTHQVNLLRNCARCHGLPGVEAVRSFSGFGGRQTPANRATTLEDELARTLRWQETRREWQELNALWSAPAE